MCHVEKSVRRVTAGMADAVDGAARPRAKKKAKGLAPLSGEEHAAFVARQENCGIVYLGRVPPYLKPTALRTMLSGYGTDVLRIYLQPEDTALRARRVRSGGNKKKCFSEGWVEFADKRRAKRIASTLNNTPARRARPTRARRSPRSSRAHRAHARRAQMGGAHRSFYASDLWNLKYLHKFKWTHLTEKIAEDARVRSDKMRAELSQARRDARAPERVCSRARPCAGRAPSCLTRLAHAHTGVEGDELLLVQGGRGEGNRRHVRAAKEEGSGRRVGRGRRGSGRGRAAKARQEASRGRARRGRARAG